MNFKLIRARLCDAAAFLYIENHVYIHEDVYIILLLVLNVGIYKLHCLELSFKAGKKTS